MIPSGKTSRPAGGHGLSASDREVLHNIYSGKLFPAAQLDAFEYVETIFPTRIVSCGGGAARPLVRSSKQLPGLAFESNGKQCDVYDYVSRNRCIGLLILKEGEIVLEHHELGHDSSTRGISMSMAKSVTSLLVGCAIFDGHIRSVDDRLVEYLPELSGSAYEQVTIRQLLQMTSGVRWNEEYTDRQSDRRHMLELQALQQPGAIMAYMASLPRVAAAGSLWNYSTGETHVAGALVHSATGKWLSNYLAERIWSRLGMDQVATWWLEAPGGLEVAGSGMRATLRDYARLGRFVCDGGSIGGETVVPKNWLRLSASCAVPAPGRGYYGLMWWPIADRHGSYADGAFRAGGIFGQYLYINPAARTVIAVWSMRSKPMGAEAIDDNDFFNSVVEALR